MYKPEIGLSVYRRNLLSELEGDILEIGIGTGVNLKYYSSKAKVLGIDPSSYMLQKAMKKIQTHTNIELRVGTIETTILKDEYVKRFDYIICTLVLCTVPNPNQAITNYRELLKPNGELIVLEHIQHASKRNALIFNIINPFWKRIGEGCNLNRQTDVLIKSLGFKSKNESDELYVLGNIPWYVNVFVKD